MPTAKRTDSKLNQGFRRDAATASAIPASSVAGIEFPDLSTLRGLRLIAFQLAVFLLGFVITVARRPDALFNPQFYAEDGWVWYPSAYDLGLRSFFVPVAGYLHAFIRSAALFSLMFPFHLAPLVLNLIAMVVQVLPANLLLSSRFRQIDQRIRLLGAFVYLAIPNSWEVDANITNVQWHLALIAGMLLLAQPPKTGAWKIFDSITLVFTSFSTPISALLVPVAALQWWIRRQPWAAISFALVTPGAVVETLVSFFSHTRQLAPNGATLVRLIRILGGQVFFSSVWGMQTQRLLGLGNSLFVVDVVALTGGLALTLYALFRAPVELKLFIAFCFAVLALGLAHPLAGPPNGTMQWEYLCVPGRCVRYFFLPTVAFLALLLWVAARKASPKSIRYLAIALLLVLPIGIIQDWRYSPTQDFHFARYAARFESAPAGIRFSIPIPPAGTLDITKH